MRFGFAITTIAATFIASGLAHGDFPTKRRGPSPTVVGNVPINSDGNLIIRVVDRSGTPLSNARVILGVKRDGQRHERIVPLAAGTGSLVHLELPMYANSMLSGGEPYPPCKPINNPQVDVDVTVKVNGYTSTDTASFDNCEYFHAQRALPKRTDTAARAAMTFTFRFPEDATRPMTTATKDSNALDAWIVTLSCSDAATNGFASGCARTEYRLDGGAVVPYTEPVAVHPTRRFEFRSIDAAGNSESFRRVPGGAASTRSGSAVRTTGDGYLQISSEPPAAIAVDGVDTGLVTPIRGRTLALSPGRHRVAFKIRSDSYTFAVEIKTGKTTKLSKRLE